MASNPEKLRSNLRFGVARTRAGVISEHATAQKDESPLPLCLHQYMNRKKSGLDAGLNRSNMGALFLSNRVSTKGD